MGGISSILGEDEKARQPKQKLPTVLNRISERQLLEEREGQGMESRRLPEEHRVDTEELVIAALEADAALKALAAKVAINRAKAALEEITSTNKGVLSKTIALAEKQASFCSRERRNENRKEDVEENNKQQEATVETCCEAEQQQQKLSPMSSRMDITATTICTDDEYYNEEADENVNNNNNSPFDEPHNSDNDILFPGHGQQRKHDLMPIEEIVITQSK